MALFTGNEAAYLQQQYRTQDNLAVRIRTHELYTHPKVDFVSWMLDQIPWQGDEMVIDVGCGAGIYLQQTQKRCRHLIAGDLSWGMLQSLPPTQANPLNLDAQHLPFANQIADVIFANHMLYHVPNQNQALAEIRRVLRPQGWFLAATNSRDTTAELATLIHQAGQELGLSLPELPFPAVLHFNLEEGKALLQPHFASVKRVDLPSAFVFPHPQPVIDYLTTTKERYEAVMPASITWTDFAQTLHTLLSQHIAQHGVFRVNKLTGVFVCQNGA